MKKPTFILLFLWVNIFSYANTLHKPVVATSITEDSKTLSKSFVSDPPAVTVIPDANGIVYINASAVSGGDGSSWSHALDSLNTALNAALTNTSIKQIWVAEGTYQPGLNGAFFMVENVSIYGGFSGNETSLNQRNLSAGLKSVLEGNSNSVFINNRNGLTKSAVLNGFTITGGNGNNGGGMSNTGVSPTITNCTFIDNKVSFNGGGMYNNQASPILSDCIFFKNNAGNGGGISNDSSSAPLLNNCSFYENTASAGGGGQNNNTSSAIFMNCNFSGNSASLGAGIQNINSSPTLTNCGFTGNNVSIGQGSGMYNQNASPTLLNCTISGNNALAGNGGGMYNQNSSPVITNSIIWGNSDGIDNSNGSAPDITYSSVQGLTGGGSGNLSGSINPLFRNAPDYTTAPFTNGNYQLLAGSLCTNAGNNAALGATDTVDLAGGRRIVGGIVDLGAYEDQYLVSPGVGGIVYVNAASTGGNGSSWSSAIDSLNIALDAAKTDTSIHQIWVAQGTYSPASGESFTMDKNVEIYGSFKGTEAEISQRNLQSGLTSILKGNGSTVIVNDSNMLSNTALLNGFIVTGGKAVNGGGIYNNHASPTISQCIFTGNTGTVNGGGMYNNNSSSPVIINCIFSGNTSNTYGGGMLNQSSSPSLINCLFNGNLTGTTGFGGGGGIFNYASSPSLTNCTFAGNKAPSGSGGGLNDQHASSSTLVNCIIWGNSDGISGNNANVTYSLVQGWQGGGTGNLPDTTNPKFTNSPLYTTAPFSDGNYRLQAGSAAVNKGSNAALPLNDSTDLAGNPRIFQQANGGVVDMGAYEYQNVPNNVVITAQASDTTVCPGANVFFAVTATGDNLQYQWQSSVDNGKTWNNEAGETSDTLKISTVQANDNGNRYRVIITGAWNTDTSNVVSLIVNTMPVINTQPKDTTVDIGNSASFSVSASGTITGYQWQVSADNGATWSDIPGSVADTLQIANITNIKNGYLYRVIVIGGCANDTSESATLSVNPPLLILSPVTLLPGYVDVPYSQTFTTQGGIAPYTYKETGALPPGITFTDGTISGTPGAIGNYPIQITVTDNSTGKGAPFSLTKDYTLIILSTGSCITITSSLQSQIVCEGSNVSFGIAANNATGYQWQSSVDSGKTWNDITGATDDSLSLNNVPFSEVPVQYQVIIKSACGNLTSGSATLTVLANATINKQPVTQMVCDSSNVTFSIGASGTNLSYQWQSSTDKGNTWSNINGSTDSVLNIAEVTSADSGNQYRVMINGRCSSITSDTATLQVTPATVILKQPLNQSVCDSSQVSFTVDASGTNLIYQWQSSVDYGNTWTDINGETKDTLTLPQATMTNEHEQFRVIINGTCGHLVSNPAILSIVNQPTTMATQPESQIVCDSSKVIFSISATGPTLSYQWQFSVDSVTWTNINGAIKDTLILDTATIANSGFYRAIASSFCQNTFSDVAKLTVNPNTDILTQPSNQSVCDSGSATFKVNASGTHIQYQWQIFIDSTTWTNISGANADSLTLSNVDSSNNGTRYRVIVTGTCGMVISDSVLLAVFPITNITLQLTNDTVCAGSTAQFKIKGVGNALQYQWQSSADGKTWNNISGATDTVLSISNAQTTDSGTYYRALVSSSCADLVSDSALLVVGAIPTITITPQTNNPVPRGVLMQLTASGAQSYQWSNSPGIQHGWTDSLLSIMPDQEATYTVTGTSRLGCSAQQSYAIRLMTDKSLIVNNIVSPNGDGKNDTWFIQNITSFPNNEVMIYDRAGRMIYHQKNYDNQWAGTINGSPLREGTYYYIFIVNNGSQVFKGFIELLNEKW